MAQVPPEGFAASRRRFLGLSALTVVGALLPRTALAAASPARALSLLNTHTGERLRAVYWEEGRYVQDAVADLNRILRDHRSGDVFAMDLRLLDLLNTIGGRLGTAAPFHVISGYRSPRTNAALRRAGRGVATRSLHTVGKAADIRVPGVGVYDVQKVAVALEAGGVGCYPGPNFVHVDVGRVRYW